MEGGEVDGGAHMQMKNRKADWQLGGHMKTHETLSNKLSNKLNGKKRKFRGVDGYSGQTVVGCAKVFIFYICTLFYVHYIFTYKYACILYI
jgi:hypothetical protein